MLIASRIVLAISTGMYTVVSLNVGASLVPPEKRGSAIGIILMGGSGAMVLGIPFGVLIGEYFGWRYVFAMIAVFSLITALAIYKFIPSSKGEQPVPLSNQLSILKKRKPVIGLLISLLWITGYSAVYTYISPFLQENTGLSVSSVSFMLTVFGISGVFGSYIGGYATDKWGVPKTLFLSLILHVFALFALTWAAGNFVGAAIMMLSLLTAIYAFRPERSRDLFLEKHTR